MNFNGNYFEMVKSAVRGVRKQCGHLSCGRSSSIHSLGMKSNVDVTTEHGGSLDGVNGGNC